MNYQPGDPVEAVNDLDQRIHEQVLSMHKIRWWMTTCVITLAIASVAVLGLLLYRTNQHLAADERRQTAACSFFADMAELPFSGPDTPTPPWLVRLALDARLSYTGRGCGALPPVRGNLLYWEQHYHLHITS